MAELRELKEKLFLITSLSLAVLAILPIFHILLSIFYNGLPVLISAGIDFLVDSSPPPGRGLGGIGPSLVGTFMLALISSLIGIPLSFASALFFVEFPDNVISRGVRVLSKALLQIPSILVGMLVYTIMVVPMGKFSMLAGSLALAIMMIPYVTTYVEEALENVPKTYKEAGYALGLSRTKVVFKISVSIAKRGILTGVLMGFAKVTGETAPLLFTVGKQRQMISLDPLGYTDSISLLIFDFIQTPYANWHRVAWGSALILTSIFLLIFLAARSLTRRVVL
ncbi:MAG: phosphate ABC transporter permease PstA [Candidatus Korarchaeum sp.]|jgi:phosphate transport system permease protein|nr:phosphate ABC transporter permease PstA [Candidatus Korarchaeum sp.]